jgi:hypothetical protein
MTNPELTPLLNGRAPGNSFVLRNQKMVYISVTKVACTALRWMVADLAGEELDSFYPALSGHQTRLMTIHRERTHWKQTPQVFNVPARERAQISRDNGWFIFAVVRDPWSRLWSAWQSKMLVRHRPYVEKYGSEPWFPRVPEKAQDVIDDFHTFVDASPWLTNPRMIEDFHFLPQVRSVHPDDINYTKVYDLHDMAVLIADIHSHLKTIGRDKVLYLPRSNEMPLPLIPAVLDNGVAERIAELYRDDFARYGDRWSLDTIKLQDSWTDDAIRFAAYHTVANERIGDMHSASSALRRQLNAANATIEKLEAAKLATDPPAARVAQRAKIAATKVARGVKHRLG